MLDYKEEHSVISSANNDANSSSAVTPKKKNVYFEDAVPKIPVYVPPHRRQPITKKPSTFQDTSVKCSVGSERRKSANFVQSLAPGSYMRAKYEKKKELDQQEVDSDESCDNVSITSQDEVQNEELEDVEDKRYPNTPYAYQNYLRLWENMVPYEYTPFMVPPPPYAFAYGVYPPWPSPRPFWEMMESSPPQTVPDVSKTVKEESLARFEQKAEEVEAEETSETIGDDTCSDFSPMGRWPPKFLSRSKLIDTDSDSLCSYGLDWKSHFLEKCHSYEEPYIDSHCHIDLLFSRLGYRGTWSDYRLQNQDTIPANFQGCVAVFCNPGSFKREGLWTSVAEEENVWLTFGCHPKNATEFTARAEEGLRKCLTNDKVVALGEIGLDYSGMFYQYAAVQKQVLRRQLQIALEMSLPLVIHCREAEDDCLEILEEMVPRSYKIHCHCFTGNFKSALRWLHLFPNIYLGLTPVVTYKTATGPHEVARFLPLERLLLETDSPYFLPKKIPRGDLAYSHPGMAIVVAEEVARIKNIAVRDVLKACRQNTLDMYGV
ncbi:hypothetical protein FSP39_005981 [Pinctada imbricata]|uniref:Uncharacterized protein n=1 Tax=Pinctada imbricata TaxID=66713 RepID=A0AA88XWK6_PINIB|nr:hypothetical protein FSP39_005981 [Pinctada imbricata]